MSTTPAPTGSAPDGLIYVSDEAPGFSRLRRGTGFVYRRPDGSKLTDAKELQRIRALAIPPAYTRVWICTSPHGHLQATGRDARGRKQYRYHAGWRSARDAHKFDRLLEFAAALPRIRARVKRDLALPVRLRVLRDSVLATIVRLLDTTLVRVGNDEYARSNGSYGLTTLRNRHAEVQGRRVSLRFRGKSGVVHEVELDDARVAHIVRRCQALPGQELFQYLDDAGAPHTLGSADVNEYLRAASGADFTAKDFRTWHGSVHAYSLAAGSGESTPRARTRAVLGEVARRLGNTIAVCRKAYVHPRVLDLLLGEVQPAASTRLPRRAGLSGPERELLGFLRGTATGKTRSRTAGKPRSARLAPRRRAV